MTTPVVFVIFKRPELTRQSFARIREARPPRLYILADGPRADKPGEDELCEATRRETENVDWPCEVIREFSDKNLGCQERIGGSLGKIFEREETAIIVEDDCLPDPSFFPYCEAMLEHYKDTPQVGQISGLNVLWNRYKPPHDIFFSKYAMCWGWATWADRWQHWDRHLEAWPGLRDDAAFHEWLGLPREWPYWEGVFDKLHSKSSPWDTWAFPWIFTNFARRWLSVTPSRNLVTNVGFGEASTHTAQDNPSLQPPACRIEPPYSSPNSIAADAEADALTFRTYFLYEEARPWPRLRNTMKIRLGQAARKLLGKTS